MSKSLLNPGLYSNMLKCFGPGNVGVRKQGVALKGFYYDDPIRGGRRLRITEQGEMYTANCPFCGDSRKRLAVDHRYGIFDPHVRIPTKDGTGFYNWYGWELWRCFNEECQSEYDNRCKLKEAIGEQRLGHITLNIPDVEVVSAPKLEPCTFPGLMLSLDELNEEHIAIRYLRQRNYDIRELVEKWKVGYAAEVPSRIRGSMMQGRIVIPVYVDSVMVGWQARYPGELNWKDINVPKYLTYFPKSLVVYGLDYTDEAEHIVLCEGVTDVWRYGYGAVCGFGKVLSRQQAELLASRLKNRPLVLVPDQNDPESEPNFFKSASLVIQAGFKGVVAVLPLPHGKDPATMTYEQLHKLTNFSIEAAKKEHNHD